MSLSMVNSS